MCGLRRDNLSSGDQLTAVADRVPARLGRVVRHSLRYETLTGTVSQDNVG
jgi:hypothetical protein